MACTQQEGSHGDSSFSCKNDACIDRLNSADADVADMNAAAVVGGVSNSAPTTILSSTVTKKTKMQPPLELPAPANKEKFTDVSRLI